MVAGTAVDGFYFNERLSYEDAERAYQERLAGTYKPKAAAAVSDTLGGLLPADALKQLQSAAALSDKVQALSKENKDLKQVVDGLEGLLIGLRDRIDNLEKQNGVSPVAAAPAAKPAADDDDDVDLFASDEEDSAEAEKLKAERVAAYQAKKSHKPVLIAKSSILLDIKPWDDETDMEAMQKEVRSITMDGLLWAAHAKLVPVAFGVKKLQIGCVVEDDKVSIEELQEKIEGIEELVQSVDIAAFNKI